MSQETVQTTTSGAIGAASGSEADIVSYRIAEYLGRKRFATLYGLSWTAYAIGGATGPMLMGHSFDTAGTYVPPWLCLYSRRPVSSPY